MAEALSDADTLAPPTIKPKIVEKVRGLNPNNLISCFK
jgi:hypothetical protein